MLTSAPATGFFFQAEDGIRDTSVTGVQTCALPIWGRRLAAKGARRSDRLRARESSLPGRCDGPAGRGSGCRGTGRGVRGPVAVTERSQIGRASCREAGEIAGGAGAVGDGMRYTPRL